MKKRVLEEIIGNLINLLTIFDINGIFLLMWNPLRFECKFSLFLFCFSCYFRTLLVAIKPFVTETLVSSLRCPMSWKGVLQNDIFGLLKDAILICRCFIEVDIPSNPLLYKASWSCFDSFFPLWFLFVYDYMATFQELSLRIFKILF